MTPVRFEGMKARASGIRVNPHPERTTDNHEWRRGFDIMDDQIQQTLANARSMLIDMHDMRRDRMAAGSTFSAR